ncbi:hypothetical protein EVAR_82213_1 [Eumeta japonica]|uniref:Uncharacterized protein n=1 Tax=Eumeta variegata TaxID=151549 RepID=A0A4C1W7R2_EUMVA|nr:hypothetical protein EVAR_82213_1 [Eumeta japonica]
MMDLKQMTVRIPSIDSFKMDQIPENINTTDEVTQKAPEVDGVSNRLLKLLPPNLILILVAILYLYEQKETNVIGIPKPVKP